MTAPSLDTLLLTQQELQFAQQKVREMAYLKWRAAGCPENAADKFWREAEIEWIEYFYVPDRDAKSK